MHGIRTNFRPSDLRTEYHLQTGTGLIKEDLAEGIKIWSIDFPLHIYTNIYNCLAFFYNWPHSLTMKHSIRLLLVYT